MKLSKNQKEVIYNALKNGHVVSNESGDAFLKAVKALRKAGVLVKRDQPYVYKLVKNHGYTYDPKAQSGFPYGNLKGDILIDGEKAMQEGSRIYPKSNCILVTNERGKDAIFDSYTGIEKSTNNVVTCEAVKSASKAGYLTRESGYEPRDSLYNLKRFPPELVRDRVIRLQDGRQVVVELEEFADPGEQTVNLIPFNPESW